MPVYLDTARNEFNPKHGRRMVMCHMIADTPEELHAMAAKIGMRREWFQGKSSFPHYDVCLSRKRQAIKYGATVLQRLDFINKKRQIEASDTFKSEK
jgi:hypothetical protein